MNLICKDVIYFMLLEQIYRHIVKKKRDSSGFHREKTSTCNIKEMGCCQTEENMNYISSHLYLSRGFHQL